MPINNPENDILLDGRYKIIRKIGEGGFGITYEAVNIHNSARVAVKECKSEADKPRFLRETRVLRDFADEPAVVTVLDSFEEEGTAYIVMEYLEGVTIAREIKTNGKWPAEKTVRKLVPVMKALEKMHGAGVIHRDISPDNLMYMPDGSVILMDFGAVLPAEKNDFTRTAIFKSVYSPPEQRDDAFRIGSWSDVYALCATIWFIITGIEPEDSLSRLLYDELQRPSEAGADILPAAEEALMKGLALIKDGRTQDILTLRTELEEVYPDLSEEEKKEIERRRRKRRRIIVSCICAAAALTAVLLYTFRLNILFSFIDTETIMLNGKEMTDEEYSVCSDTVEKRFKAYIGEGRYLTKEEDRLIYYELPIEDIPDSGNVPLDLVIRTSVTRPMTLSVFHMGEESDVDLGIFSQTDDITGFETDGDDALITFSEAAAEKLDGLLDEKDNHLRFFFDLNQNYNPVLSYEGLTLGDGKTVRVGSTGTICNYDGITLYIKYEYKVPFPLMKKHFTESPTPQGFYVDSEWMTKWENVSNTLFPGKNQKNQDEIPGTTISTRYSLASFNDTAEGYNPALLSFQAGIKNRLDGLGIPYAVGMDLVNPDYFIVKTPTEDVWMTELADLGDYVTLHLGNSLTQDPSSQVSEILVEKHEDGSFSLLAAPTNYSEDSFSETIAAAAEHDSGELYLYMNDLQIACCDAEAALESFQNDGTVRFDRWAFYSHPEMDEPTLHFANWLHAALAGYFSTFACYDNTDIEIRDENNAPVFFDIKDLFPDDLSEGETGHAAKELVTAWNKDSDGKMDFSYNELTRYLKMSVYNVNLADPEEALAPVRELFAQYKDEINEGYFNRIDITLYQEGPSSEHKNAGALYYNMSYDEGRLVNNFTYAGDYTEEYEKYLEQHPLM